MLFLNRIRCVGPSYGSALRAPYHPSHTYCYFGYEIDGEGEPIINARNFRIVEEARFCQNKSTLNPWK
jgi:hypothetical protein